jgi:hypothetical protein
VIRSKLEEKIESLPGAMALCSKFYQSRPGAVVGA